MALLVASVGLSIPVDVPDSEDLGSRSVFRWDADTLFASLEALFLETRTVSFAEAESAARAMEASGSALRAELSAHETAPFDALRSLAEAQFRYAVLGAAHPQLLDDAEAFVTATRVAVMRAAAGWPSDRATHEALYRVVFGGRMAIEEALVQAGGGGLAAVEIIEEIASEAPYIDVQGVRVHSGDLLLSRGGAPTSALIARGSDFANTFSHVGLAHVDPETGRGTVVESLIESGSVLTTVDEYLASKKHRILVLRMRPDHPALLADPLLPHRAATRMLDRLRAVPVPYDFAMRWQEDGSMFCSEVVYHAFRAEGAELWSIRSAMTAAGLVRWLASMGVREFHTLVPSDLEYDARFRAVAAWRDIPALLEYRRDNAITDVLLEEADLGRDLGYPWYALPMARLLKGASVVQGLTGREPSIPRGMSADAALRVNALVSRVNPTIKAELAVREEAFHRDNGYRAPYWTLVELARASLAAVDAELGEALTPRE